MGASRIYLSPGLFGFERIGAYVYFRHVERALLRRFADAGREARTHLVKVSPTASILHRARTLASTIAATARRGDRVHLLGHSTGGIDARLLATPGARLGREDAARTAFRPLLRSITCMNSPHYGTPLAGFFATVSGQRLLYLLSGLTVPVLKVGAPPLTLTASLVAALPRLDRALGLRVGLVDRSLEMLVQTLDDASSRDLHAWLGEMGADQGGVLQLSPEAMDVFQATVGDDPDVVYQCTASWVPSPGMRHWARTVATPWTGPSATMFAMLSRITAAHHPLYPCEPAGPDGVLPMLSQLGELPTPGANDGIVPFRSQLWGRPVWVGAGDHLDVVGHFAGREETSEHHDWLTSGAGFDEARFDSLFDAVVNGMLEADAPPR